MRLEEEWLVTMGGGRGETLAHTKKKTVLKWSHWSRKRRRHFEPMITESDEQTAELRQAVRGR